jgi:urease accessory protein
MRATARVVASCDAAGQTRLTVLRGEAPLLPRQTGVNEVHFVGGAAGPLGGDHLRIEVEVGAGATLRLGSVAATLALPGRDGALSRLEVHATVATAGRLVWLPEPLIAAYRCRHETLSTVELADSASLVWREELVCGRHAEESGDARLATVVSCAGRPLYHNELSVGPSAPGWSGPAVLGTARVYASLLLVDQGRHADDEHRSSARLSLINGVGAVMRLAGGGVVVSAMGGDLPAVRRALQAKAY